MEIRNHLASSEPEDVNAFEAIWVGIDNLLEDAIAKAKVALGALDPSEFIRLYNDYHRAQGKTDDVFLSLEAIEAFSAIEILEEKLVDNALEYSGWRHEIRGNRHDAARREIIQQCYLIVILEALASDEVAVA